MRAYFYFNLVRAYGDVPYFTEMVTTDQVNSLTRTPAQEIFNAIIAECDKLSTELPADYTKLGLDGIAPAENGRVTCYAALALKARAALYAASPLFNPENNKDLWRRAAEANKEVIETCTANGFKLSKYSELWGPNNWSNNEMILFVDIMVTSAHWKNIIFRWECQVETPVIAQHKIWLTPMK